MILVSSYIQERTFCDWLLVCHLSSFSIEFPHLLVESLILHRLRSGQATMCCKRRTDGVENVFKLFYCIEATKLVCIYSQSSIQKCILQCGALESLPLYLQSVCVQEIQPYLQQSLTRPKQLIILISSQNPSLQPSGLRFSQNVSLMITSYWLLVTSYWLLVASSQLLVTSNQLLVVTSNTINTSYWYLVTSSNY